VFGGTGFVGSYIVKELLSDGIHVLATCRNLQKSQWVKDLGGVDKQSIVSLHEFEYGRNGKPVDDTSTKVLTEDLLPGTDAIFFCIGYEKQEPETVTYMFNACLTILDAAKQEMEKSNKKITVVVTSSTGSTNPPDAQSDALKNELDFWSDPELQKKNGRFSPAAKTLMEESALEFVGRNKRNEIIDNELASKTPRLCIMNPSLILAPQLKPGEITGNGLPWFARIVKGDAMNQQIPNDSMSIIHCEDLAKLSILAAFPKQTCDGLALPSGRYFGVNQSWAWEEILLAIKSRRPDFNIPPKKFEKQNPVTKFDNTRRDSLGLGVMKDLSIILDDTITFLEEKGLIK